MMFDDLGESQQPLDVVIQIIAELDLEIAGAGLFDVFFQRLRITVFDALLRGNLSHGEWITESDGMADPDPVSGFGG